MKILLAENIRFFRKASGLTQEQLAEAMGVTVGAVSKWESGATTRDLSSILELAALFAVSVDVLLGYQLQNTDARQLAEKIHALMLDKRYEEALRESKKALSKYPNHFDIVYRSADLYHAAGIEQRNHELLHQARGLLEHSLLLLEQNTNAQIDEAVIQIQIAKLYAAAGETDRALTHYKKHNWAGINNGRIGTLLSSAGRYEEARPYLSASALEQITELIQVTIGMSACAAQTGSPSEVFQVLSWMRQVLEGLKIPGKVCYLDKADVFLLHLQAQLCADAGDLPAAKDCLQKAVRTARRFDTEPVYTMKNIRFYHEKEPLLLSDSFGETAMQGLENSILHGTAESSQILREIWREIINESE